MLIKSQRETARELVSVVAPDLERVDSLLREAAAVKYLPLRTVLEPIIAAKGKRLRPALLLLTARQNIYEQDTLVPAGAAVELLHTATLIHDDMVDDATMRRGAITISTAMSDKVSVLVGDYLFAKSSYLAAMTNNVRVMRVFGEALMTIADGQLQEIFASTSPEILRKDYYDRIACKTASLFRTSTMVGAILSHASEPEIEAFGEYGMDFGMAFQIVDDILDFMGDERDLGKPVGGDLRQGTLTLPALCLMQLYPEDDLLQSILRGDQLSEQDINKAVEMVRNSPAIEMSYAIVRRYVESANNWLKRIPDSRYRQVMGDLAESLLQAT